MTNGLRIVVDTNIYYIFFYNPLSRSGQIIKYAVEKRIELYSPDTVKEELRRTLNRKLGFSEKEAESLISSLPVRWIDKYIYEDFLSKASIMPHSPDRPVFALSLALGCGILTTNKKHFRQAGKVIKVWEIDDLLKNIKQ